MWNVNDVVNSMLSELSYGLYQKQIERYNKYRKNNQTKVYIALGVSDISAKFEYFNLFSLVSATKEFASKDLY